MTPLSDLDIAVLRRDQQPYDAAALLDIIRACKETFRTEHVDLIDLSRAPPLLRYHALVTGEILIERDHVLRVRAHLTALRDATDTARFRQRCITAMCARSRRRRAARTGV